MGKVIHNNRIGDNKKNPAMKVGFLRNFKTWRNYASAELLLLGQYIVWRD